MEHSKKYYKIKSYYDNGLWTLNMVRNSVVKGWIREDEFKEITNELYDE